MMAPDVLQVPPHFDFPAKLDLGQSQPTPSASIPVGSVNALDASNGDAAHAQLQKDVDLSGLLPALDGRQAQGDLVQGLYLVSASFCLVFHNALFADTALSLCIQARTSALVPAPLARASSLLLEKSLLLA